MNIIKYLVYLLIVFSVVKYFQKVITDNYLFITIIIVIGFMITDYFFKPKEHFAKHTSCNHYYDDYRSKIKYGPGDENVLDPETKQYIIYNIPMYPKCGKGKFCRKRRADETGGTSFGICQKIRNHGHKCAFHTWCDSYNCGSGGKCKKDYNHDL
jgi:hypothetical protein